MLKKSRTSVRLFSFADDQPRNGQGMLIPRRGRVRTKHMFTPQSALPVQSPVLVRVVVVVMAAFMFVLLGGVGYGYMARADLTPPMVTLVDPYTQSASVIEYGPLAALGQDSFFTDTRDSFIDQGITFIEVDLVTRQLRLFKKGVLLQSIEVFGAGEIGSWWETPSGLYQVEEKNEKDFTTVGQVFLPWLLTFEGNYVIHGWPVYPDGDAVPAEYVGGGIRLSDDAAKDLFLNVQVGTPVLVRAAAREERAVFVYEPQVPEIDTPHYFIADMDNGTILAATDLNAPAPIASLTKLMTAVVAAEHIDLDGRVRVSSPTFVSSLIPRLAERNSVSVYSLLQLLLVESSNEAAETIAGEYGREEFIAAMNEKAQQLGMVNSRFADPSGLSAENVSTVGDLYRLTKYIYENRSFIFEITANAELPSAYVGGEFAGLINFNEVEGMDSFVGGKVGETTAAGQTSVSLHQVQIQGEERVLAVIMLGSDGRTEDIKTLLSYVQNRFGR